MRTIIIGGVAGGMSAATRLRRLDETGDIIVVERSGHVSFANCGLPYHVGGFIESRDALAVMKAVGDHLSGAAELLDRLARGEASTAAPADPTS